MSDSSIQLSSNNNSILSIIFDHCFIVNNKIINLNHETHQLFLNKFPLFRCLSCDKNQCFPMALIMTSPHHKGYLFSNVCKTCPTFTCNKSLILPVDERGFIGYCKDATRILSVDDLLFHNMKPDWEYYQKVKFLKWLK